MRPLIAWPTQHHRIYQIDGAAIILEHQTRVCIPAPTLTGGAALGKLCELGALVSPPLLNEEQDSPQFKVSSDS